jgi:ADP-heptose:LPS heptosyltransferase/GT2 family glycosyltransferase
MSGEAPLSISEDIAERTAEDAAAGDGSGSGDEETIFLHIDNVALTDLGLLSISGWAVAESGVESVAILVNASCAGEAELGLARPDVASNYPAIAQALRSGFALRAELGAPFEGEHTVTAVITTAARRTRQTEVRVGAAAPRMASIDEPSLKLYVDRPAIVDGRVPETIRGALQIEGWALAQEGVASIEVSIDWRHFATARYGIARLDVGTAWPNWESALLSGFVLPIPARALSTGKHMIRVELRTGADRRRALEFAVETEQPPDEGAPWTLRRKMSRAEVALTDNVIAGAGWRPRFGILLRVDGWDGAEAGLMRTLESVREQVYDRWRIVVAGGEPGLAEAFVARVGDAMPELRPRVEAAADGSCLADLFTDRTRGERPDLIAVAAVGDTLGCNALLELAATSSLHPEADFFYADERRHSPVTGKIEAFFKPQWSPDLLMATNYIGRLWCAEAGLIDRVGARLDEWNDFGEYDLVLRCTEAARTIHHVPAVLCERGRETIDEPAQERRALSRALDRRGIRGELSDGFAPGYHRLRRQHGFAGLVSVIVPSGGNVALLRRCVAGLLEATAYKNFELVITHNTELNPEMVAYLGMLGDDPRVGIIDATGPFNFSRICNLGVAKSRGELLLFLNDDTEVIEPDWLDSLIAHAERPEVGAVGARLLYPDGSIQHAGMFWVGRAGRHSFRFAPGSEPGYFGFAVTPRNVISVTGACIMMRRSWFEAIGGFDESHSVINNDVDLCLRCWSHGGLVVYEPAATLIHHEMASRYEVPEEYDVDGFAARWDRLFQAGDPYYHPNLARNHDDYSVDVEPVQVLSAGHPLFRSEDVGRILVVKLDHLGDFITGVPALSRLHEHFPDAELYLLASPGNSALAKAFVPWIKEVIPFEFFYARSGLGQRRLTEADLQALQRRLAPYRFDVAIDLRKALDTREVLRFTGARWLAGYDCDGRFPWLDIGLEWEGDGRLIPKRSHIGADLSRLVDAIVLATTRQRRVLPAPSRTDQDHASGNAADGRLLVCVHPGVGSETRQWPAAHFAKLIDLLVANHEVAIALIGGPEEAEVAAEVLARVKSKDAVKSLVGATRLSDLPALLASAALFVGNNSGPKHIAAGLGVPTVGIHSGVVDAREWGPIGPNAVAVRREMSCSPCYLAEAERCPRALACLTDLRPGEVYEVCRRLLLIGPTALADPAQIPIPSTDAP